MPKQTEIMGDGAPPTTFEVLSKIELDTDKRGQFTYASWSEAWAAVKRHDPSATFEYHENEMGTLGLYDHNGAFAKVSVTIDGQTHTMYLPVMDHRNQAIPPDKITPTDVNKAYARCLVKAIALHGLGLYVYKGEDYPETPTDPNRAGVKGERDGSVEKVSEDEALTLEATCNEVAEATGKESKKLMAAMLGWAGVRKVEDFPKAKYQGALNKLAKTLEKAEAA